MKKKTNLESQLAVLVFLLAMAGLAQGRTITVGHGAGYDFQTIQSAIDSCNDRDVVIVADGIYSGDGGPNPPVVDFRGKAITVRSENGPEKCILCGGDYVVRFRGGEAPTSVLSGFTVTGADPGAGICCWDSSPTIMNNIITGNWSEYGEGAILVHSSSPIIVGNIITGNQVYGPCAGIVCCHGSSPTIGNNTIVGNGGNGGWYGNGGVYCTDDATATITNCIFWGNGEYDLYGCTATYSCLEHEHPGTGNIHTDPVFVNPGHSHDHSWVDFDYHLLPGSPCLDSGDNSAIAQILIEDMDGNPRIVNHTVDMGAYESADVGFLLNTAFVTVLEAGTATFTVALRFDPVESVDVTVAIESGDPDITVQSGGLLIFDSSNYDQPQTVTLAAAEDEDNLIGTALIRISGPGLITAMVTASEEDNEPISTVLYVDDSALGVNNGSNWAGAYTDLQIGLSVARQHPEVEEIHVAQGEYRPAGPSGDRNATFQLVNGMAVKGGYAGFGSPDPNARDIDLYETILSGDLNGDDVEVLGPMDLIGEPTIAENGYHVVTGSGTDQTAVLDGFIITGGNADHPDRYDPRRQGGGMYNDTGSPRLVNCRFSKNSSDRGGGGMFNTHNSGPTLTNCMFISNSAAEGGGGMANNWGSSPTLTNCTFSGNSAGSGGGMVNNRGSSPTLTNCTFMGNSATHYGGGMVNYDNSPTLTNCTFIENSAGDHGGGIRNYESNLTLTNCTFVGNSAGGTIWRGGGTWNYDSCGSSMTNCIFWGNISHDGSQVALYYGDLAISYCDIQSGQPGVYIHPTSTLNWGEGNVDADPCFVQQGYWADANDPNIVVEPGNPNAVWIDGDYHLLEDSPCIDAGDPNYVAEPNETDLDGRPRVVGGRIDMGAYEYSPPIPAEVRVVPRSINTASMGKWITCYIRLGEEYDVAEIDPNSVFIEDEIGVESLRVDEGQQVAIARFSRSEVQEIFAPGDVELTVSGELSDGTRFEGTDTIRVIDKGGKNIEY